MQAITLPCIHAKCMDCSGSLPRLLHTSLKDCHTEDLLLYEEVIFDFGMDGKLGWCNWWASLMGARLTVWDFQWKIIFVTVTVHSGINCSDLLAGLDKAGGNVAMEVEDFMKCIFIPPLDKIFMVPQSLASMGQGFAHGMLAVWCHLFVVLIEIGGRRFAHKVPEGQGDDWVAA
ncbi:hypothetical protein EDC04DRAFT_2600200 [Pisolithus marmoratus]|nr:hypothetical protein EDC04DRAFT_2600200 [Pisolithus marmoratus]